MNWGIGVVWSGARPCRRPLAILISLEFNGWLGGAFAKAVEGVAKLFGNTAALKALRAGEDRGATTYEESLSNPHLTKEFVEFVRTTLLPQTRSHVQTLDRLMQSVA